MYFMFLLYERKGFSNFSSWSVTICDCINTSYLQKLFIYSAKHTLEKQLTSYNQCLPL